MKYTIVELKKLGYTIISPPTKDAMLNMFDALTDAFNCDCGMEDDERAALAAIRTLIEKHA